MIDRARHLIQRMVNNIISVSEKFNRNICKQYDSIVKKITEQSETTDQLVKQMKYVESLRAGELLQLKVSFDWWNPSSLIMAHYIVWGVSS